MIPASVLLVLAANVVTTSASPVRGRTSFVAGSVGLETHTTLHGSSPTSLSDRFPELSQAQLQNMEKAYHTTVNVASPSSVSNLFPELSHAQQQSTGNVASMSARFPELSQDQLQHMEKAYHTEVSSSALFPELSQKAARFPELSQAQLRDMEKTKHDTVNVAISSVKVEKATASYMSDEEAISDDEHPNIVETIGLSQAELEVIESQSSGPNLSTLALIFCVAGLAAAVYTGKTDQFKKQWKQGSMQDLPYVQEALAAFGPMNVGQKAVMDDFALLDDEEVDANDSMSGKDASVGFFAEEEVEPEVPLLTPAP